MKSERGSFALRSRARRKMKFCYVLLFLFGQSNFCTADFGLDVLQELYDTADAVLPDCIFGAGTLSFVLFSREYPNGYRITEFNDSDLPIPYEASVIFLIHGFISEANNTNYFELATTWIRKKDVYIFSLDWSEGACNSEIRVTDLLSYGAAVSNIGTVGFYIANFTMYLAEEYGVQINDTLVVGHSLGAHIAGHAGKVLQRISGEKYWQIIGLDPAGPLFEGVVCEMRLCKYDALFVQAFHTSYILGMQEPVGHDDFYFNGGYLQPGCGFNPSCSHSRAVEYLTYSLDNNCTYTGVLWRVGTNFSPEMYKECEPRTCSNAGVDAMYYPARGTFYVATSVREPYCTNMRYSLPSIESE